MRRARHFGPYLLLYRLASGGMAELFRARTLPPAEPVDVAIKRPLPPYNDDDDLIVMLADEARITAMFEHPNIARTYEFGVVDGQHFLAMEFVDGCDLRSVLKRALDRREPLPPAVAAYLLEQALEGLHHAHEARGVDGQPLHLVHRDFSPSNILIGYDGAVKLIDFGIAKGRLNRARTRAGFIKGKVRYLSPEQTRAMPLDRRSDVFSAGVVLYQALTGRMPFRGIDDGAVMEAIRHREPIPPSVVGAAVDGAFDAIVARALAKSLDRRYPDASSFAAALADWRRSHDIHVDQTTIGVLINRMFAQERRENADLYAAFADIPASDRTPTDEMQRYTRLVGVGPEQPERDLHEELDAWLAARRAALGEASGEPDGNTADESWTASRRPGWVDEDGATSPGVPSALDEGDDLMAIDTGSIDTGSIDTGSIDTGSIDTGSLAPGS